MARVKRCRAGGGWGRFDCNEQEKKELRFRLSFDGFKKENSVVVRGPESPRRCAYCTVNAKFKV
jgi:hypothetical protein